MTRTEAIAKAQRKHQRTGNTYLVTRRTNHPAYPGQIVYLPIPAADKRVYAADETLVATIGAEYAASVHAGSSLPETMTLQQISDHCGAVIA